MGLPCGEHEEFWGEGRNIEGNMVGQMGVPIREYVSEMRKRASPAIFGTTNASETGIYASPVCTVLSPQICIGHAWTRLRRVF